MVFNSLLIYRALSLYIYIVLYRERSFSTNPVNIKVRAVQNLDNCASLHTFVQACTLLCKPAHIHKLSTGYYLRGNYE